MVSDGSSPSGDRFGSGYNGVHVDLHRLRLRLQEILKSIHAFESPIRLPPVLDASSASDDPSRVGGDTVIPGLRGLEESVRRDLDVLIKVCGSIILPECASSRLRGASISSFWMIRRARNLHHFRRMHPISRPCGTRFWLRLHLLWGFGVHSRIRLDVRPQAMAFLEAGRRNQRHRMSGSTL